MSEPSHTTMGPADFQEFTDVAIVDPVYLKMLQQQRRRPRTLPRWVRTALVVDIVMAVLVLGGIIGHFLL